jgi:hypothetical protein
MRASVGERLNSRESSTHFSSARSCSKSTDSRLIGAILITVPCQLRLTRRSDVSDGALFLADLTVSIRATPCLVTAFNLLSSLPPGRPQACRKETLSVFAAHFSSLRLDAKRCSSGCSVVSGRCRASTGVEVMSKLSEAALSFAHLRRVASSKRGAKCKDF